MRNRVAITLAGLLLLLASGCSDSSDEDTKAEVQRAATAATEREEAKAVHTKLEKQARENEDELREEEMAQRRAAQKAHQAELAEEKQQASTPKSTEGKTCGTWSGPESKACELAYTVCSLEAKKVVEEHYHETGPLIDEYAEEYSEKEFGSSGLSEEAAFAGCLAALMDEYDALYG